MGNIERARLIIKRGNPCASCGGDGFTVSYNSLDLLEKEPCLLCLESGRVPFSLETIAIHLYLESINDKLDILMAN